MRASTYTSMLFSIAAGFLISSSAVADEKVTIHVSSVNSYMKPVNSEIVRRFNEVYPDITVIQESPVDSWGDQVQRNIMDAATGNGPDVAEHAFNLFGQVVDRGLAVPLDQLIASETNWESLGYSASLTSLGKYNNRIWGLPFRISTPIIFFNADLVRKVGGDPEKFPTSWSEVVLLARKISDLGDQKVGMFFDYQADGNWTFQALLNLQGGRLVTPEGGIAFNGPEGLKALQLLRDIGQSGTVDMQREQARQAFSAGAIGMYVGSGSQLGNLQKATAQNFTLQTAPLPRSSDNARVPVGGGLYMLMTKDPVKQAAAWKYIKFATGPIAQTIVVENTGMMPSNDLSAGDDSLLGQFYSKNPQHLASLQQLPIVTGWTAFPGPNSVKISAVIREHLRSVVTLKVSPERALANMTKDVTPLLQ